MNRKPLSIHCLTKYWHINVLILAPSSPMEIFKLGISAYTRLNLGYHTSITKEEAIYHISTIKTGHMIKKGN